MPDYGSTDRVRRSAAHEYIQPARRRGEKVVKINSGTFGKSLVEHKILQPNRFPIICNALRSEKFQKDNQLTLVEVQGPPSGRSSTMTFVYRLESMPDAPITTSGNEPSLFESLRGVLRKSYKQLGGADAFHHAERESWER
jgi:hypothetical protein